MVVPFSLLTAPAQLPPFTFEACPAGPVWKTFSFTCNLPLPLSSPYIPYGLNFRTSVGFSHLPLYLYLCWSFCYHLILWPCLLISIHYYDDDDDGVYEFQTQSLQLLELRFWSSSFFFFSPSEVWNLLGLFEHGNFLVRIWGRWCLGIMQFKQGVWMWESQREEWRMMMLRRRLNVVFNLVSLEVAYLQDQRLIAP